jgi:release factor glutamine methyltransferase
MEREPGLAVDIAPGVYPPSEDSRLLLAAVRVDAGERVLELGTGTGYIALHAAKVAETVATDIHPDAVRLARRNAVANGRRVAVVRCDLFRGLRGTFDVVVFNPPYLIEGIGGDWEARAWQGGPTGEEILLRFLPEVPAHLAPGGRAFVLVPSNRERALAAARERFDVRVADKKALFFEELLALELTDPR